LVKHFTATLKACLGTLHAMTTPNPQNPAHTFKGLADWVEVFKAGHHIDSKGRKASFSASDLEQMAANHELGAAPAVIGHPKDTDPAYAWVDGYKVDGDSLYARFNQINPAFEAGVASGAYLNRSVSVFKDNEHGWRVRHVGWLGAVPPAIDGLTPVQFAADAAADTCFEFSAPGYSLVWGLESLANLLRDFRDQMIAKDGLDAADAALPRWRIDAALDAATQARHEYQDAQQADAADGGDDLADGNQQGGSALNPMFSKPTPVSQPTGAPMSFTQEQVDAAAALAKKTAEEAAAASFSAQQAELTQLRAERQTERIGLQVAGWKAKGLVTPAEEPGLAEFMVALENGETAEFNFSASDKAAVKKTPAQFFAEFMAARKPLVRLGATSGAGDDAGAGIDGGDANQLADTARAFMKAQADKGLSVSLPEAMQHAVAQSRK
jgi:hypothetical protein